MEQELIRLKCVKEGSKLRMKIMSSGYSSHANCQCPRDIRVAGQEYTVPKEDITLANTQGKFFYRIKKGRILTYQSLDKDLSNLPDLKNLKIYDDNVTECCVCMADDETMVIFAPCGHYCCCNICAPKLKNCPMCRANITQIVTRDQLQ
jgi:hypothetical protein